MSALPITVQEPPGVQTALNELSTITTVAGFEALVDSLPVLGGVSVQANAPRWEVKNATTLMQAGELFKSRPQNEARPFRNFVRIAAYRKSTRA